MSDALALRPLAPEDAPALLRILRTPEVARWWGAPDPGFPLADEPGATRLTILVADRVAGMVQFAEEQEPRYRHASIDLFLDPAHHGRGHGTEAVRRVVALLVEERGHHRITIDPAAANTVAIKAYTKVGFRPVGILREYERDPDGPAWHDGLLMELLSRDR